MHSLSGGQKTIVSLSFVYAIQRCFELPIYIFDADRRKNVANYLNTICKSDGSKGSISKTTPQFISTTFRKELLSSADAYIGVQFRNGVSTASTVDRSEAKNFIEHIPENDKENSS